ncbi:MAG: Gfo/Idh/MocA family oxidoreductase [Bdellovibrionota bacterium]
MKTENQLRYAIIGCGLIGKKRLNALPRGSVRVACDLNDTRARDLAQAAGLCRVVADAQKAVSDKEVDVAVVATINKDLAPLAKTALLAGKHVLIEKPGAISSAELEELKAISTRTGKQVRIGYNHRYHTALQAAFKIAASGELGPLMFIRGRYGHGGRIGYDKEWRADAKLSGGGELIDQGVHLIDLASWFLGPFKHVEGHASTFFWDMKVDDNAFLSLRTEKGQTAWLHVSCTEWKNLFSLEIYGRVGKLAIDGLGGSYGVERLSYYKMLPEMGPPDTTILEFPRGDQSWKLEMDEFAEDIALGRTPSSGLTEGIHTLQVVEQIYKRSGRL